MPNNSPFKIFLSGDVMTGRGIDQILTHPSQPQIYESYVKDARDYVLLAETLNGKIPRLSQGAYVWNDGLKELERRKPELSLINLETSLTSDGSPCRDKGIQYRMHPKNIDVLKAAKINVCSLANNHILDWGVEGLSESLKTLTNESIAFAGAGQTMQEAQAPAIFPLPKTPGRILIFSMGLQSSGIPKDWAATSNQPGVWLLEDLGHQTLKQIKTTVDHYKQPGDFCIASLHWGGNWVSQVPSEHQSFAHALIDNLGFNLIHGHSSHHPLGIELYKNTPIFYGCGDLINDYEGIGNHQEFNPNLGLMYFLEFDSKDLSFQQLELITFERKKFKLNYAKDKDCLELFKALKQQSKPFNTQFKLEQNVIHLKAKTMEKRWEHFRHEADIGIRGLGPTLEDAFAMGALALTNVITDSDSIKPSKTVHIHCEAPTAEILFTDWLNAIIYNMAIHSMLFCEFQISLKGLNLEAIIKGEAVNRERHQPVVEVKGATYTELKVYKKENQWLAQCVVDV